MTLLFLALAASSNRFPWIANFFRSSALNFCVPSLLPRCICRFTEARLVNDPSTDENDSDEFGGRGRSVLSKYLGVDWPECLSPVYGDDSDACEVGLVMRGFFVDAITFSDFMLKDVVAASESTVPLPFLSWGGWSAIIVVRLIAAELEQVLLSSICVRTDRRYSPVMKIKC